jgi:hypothetical protein
MLWLGVMSAGCTELARDSGREAQPVHVFQMSRANACRDDLPTSLSAWRVPNSTRMAPEGELERLVSSVALNTYATSQIWDSAWARERYRFRAANGEAVVTEGMAPDGFTPMYVQPDESAYLLARAYTRGRLPLRPFRDESIRIVRDERAGEWRVSIGGELLSRHVIPGLVTLFDVASADLLTREGVQSGDLAAYESWLSTRSSRELAELRREHRFLAKHATASPQARPSDSLSIRAYLAARWVRARSMPAEAREAERAAERYEGARTLISYRTALRVATRWELWPTAPWDASSTENPYMYQCALLAALGDSSRPASRERIRARLGMAGALIARVIEASGESWRSDVLSATPFDAHLARLMQFDTATADRLARGWFAQGGPGHEDGGAETRAHDSLFSGRRH